MNSVSGSSTREICRRQRLDDAALFGAIGQVDDDRLLIELGELVVLLQEA